MSGRLAASSAAPEDRLIAPGLVDTELTQSLSEAQRGRIAGRSALRRLHKADDVARMVEYLLGDASPAAC